MVSTGDMDVEVQYLQRKRIPIFFALTIPSNLYINKYERKYGLGRGVV
jgi:hypothetical protein